MKRKILLGLSICQLSICGQNFHEAYAQTAKSQKNSFAPLVVPVKAPLPEKQTQAMSLPDVPEYPGKSLFKSCSIGEGGRVRLRWHVREDQQQIIDWYRNALNSSGWTSQQNDKGSVFAKKGEKEYVNVIANELVLSDGYRCELKIFYTSADPFFAR